MDNMDRRFFVGPAKRGRTMNSATLSTAPRIAADSPELEPLVAILNRLPGRRISPNTRWRWVHLGVDGIRLPALSIGCKWYSTQAAVNWFFEARTQAVLSSCEQPCDDDVTEAELAAVGL